VPGGENFPSIAIAVCVFADAAVAVPIFGCAGKKGVGLLGEKLSRRKRMEQLRAGSEQGRAEKVAAGDGRVHA